MIRGNKISFQYYDKFYVKHGKGVSAIEYFVVSFLIALNALFQP